MTLLCNFLSLYMDCRNIVFFQPSANFIKAVALFIIGFHAHDANGSAFVKFSQPLYGVLADFAQTAQGLPGPEERQRGQVSTFDKR